MSANTDTIFRQLYGAPEKFGDEYTAFSLGIIQGKKSAAIAIADALGVPIEAVIFLINTDSIPPEKQAAFNEIRPLIESLIASLVAPEIPKPESPLRKLLAEEKFSQAFDLLISKGARNAIVQQSRFAAAKKQFELGMLDFKEYDRIKKEIADALLHIQETMPITNNQPPKPHAPHFLSSPWRPVHSTDAPPSLTA